MNTSMRLAALTAALAGVNVYAVAANNVIVNGDFSKAAQLSGWTATGDGSNGSVVFVPSDDAENQPGSGSMLVTQGQGTTFERARSSCAAVTPGSVFSYGAKWLAGQASDIILGGWYSTATLACTSYSDNACTVSNGDLAAPQSVEWINKGPAAFSGFTSFPTQAGTLGNNAHSVDCSITATEAFETSSVYVDDVFFDVAPASTIRLGGYLSGNWYDHNNGGQGFQLEFTAQNNTLLAAWFTYAVSSTYDNPPIWFFMQGTYDTTANSVTVPAYYLHGAAFPPEFHSQAVINDPWGTVTFTFFDCDHGVVSWNPTMPGYDPGSMAISRLTSIAGTSCPK
jgi:hypothetical protein